MRLNVWSIVDLDIVGIFRYCAPAWDIMYLFLLVII